MNAQQAGTTSQNGRPARGLPRPMLDGLPLPYIAGNGPFLELDGDCLTDCLAMPACQVCGLEVGVDGFVIVDRDNGYCVDGLFVGSAVLDSGALHEPCLKMALRHCPHLATVSWDLTSDVPLVVVSVGESGYSAPLHASVSRRFATDVSPFEACSTVNEIGYPSRTPV